jgi:hypothetical protein
MTEIERERAGMTELRHRLLDLHKTLLDSERLRYEREHGRVEGGSQMLQLLAFDPAFAWLRVISALIVQIDEKLDDKKVPLSGDDAKRFRAEARELVMKRGGGDEFQTNFNRALQERPEVVIAQSKVAAALRD